MKGRLQESLYYVLLIRTYNESRFYGNNSGDACPAHRYYNFFIFADDTNIYLVCDDLTRLSKTVNEERQNVNNWMDCNKLALTLKKN